jgi:UPF0042 nucleotide-binding protein
MRTGGRHFLEFVSGDQFFVLVLRIGDGKFECGVEQVGLVFEPRVNAADGEVGANFAADHARNALGGFRAGGDDPESGLSVTVMSFGFKHGLPRDVDMVLDIRFLPNPYWDEELRPLTGLDAKVRERVLSHPVTEGYVDRVADLLAFVLPQCVAEGRSYLTVAVGCTGGRHRSVVVAEELARRLSGHGYRPRVAHRDMAAN